MQDFPDVDYPCMAFPCVVFPCVDMEGKGAPFWNTLGMLNRLLIFTEDRNENRPHPDVLAHPAAGMWSL